MGRVGLAVFVCEVQEAFFDEFPDSDQQGVARMLVLGAEGGARIRRVVFPAQEHGERPQNLPDAQLAVTCGDESGGFG